MDKLLSLLPLLAIYTQCEAVCLSYSPYMESATHVFYGADLNQNGILERSELDQSFQQYDNNHDGRIGIYEYKDYLIIRIGHCIEALASELFMDYDSDGDYYLDQHDFDAYYAKLDINDDGLVSSGEFIQHWINLFQTTEHIHGNWTTALPT